MAKRRAKENKKPVEKEEHKTSGLTEGRKVEASVDEKYNKQLKIVLIGIAFVFGLLIGGVFIGKELNKFDYATMEFDKIKQNEITFYHSVIPIKDLAGNLLANYNLYLRYDPRDVKIPINGTIALQRDMLISADPAIDKCEEKFFGVTLVKFLREAASRNIEIGTTNASLSANNNLREISCEDAKNGTVLLIREENETKIYTSKNNCYVIGVSDCNIGQAVERFIVATVAHSRGKRI